MEELSVFAPYETFSFVRLMWFEIVALFLVVVNNQLLHIV
jgi:hypothetical protein